MGPEPRQNPTGSRANTMRPSYAVSGALLFLAFVGCMVAMHNQMQQNELRLHREQIHALEQRVKRLEQK